MKVTVDLPDALHRRASIRAAKEGRTIAWLLEAALERMLADPTGAAPLDVPDLPSFGGRGLLPGVDLLDIASLLELLDTDGDHASVRR